MVQYSSAFPYWTCTVAGVQQTTALYNTLTLSTSAISLIDHGWANGPLGSLGGVIEGNYTAVLAGGVLGPGNPADTTLSQTGLVPATARSLLLKAYNIGSASPRIPLLVSLGGEGLTLIPLAVGTNYTLMGADVRISAGQVKELSITVPGSMDINSVFLDSLQFSNSPVPEPSVLTFFMYGALLVGRRLNRAR